MPGRSGALLDKYTYPSVSVLTAATAAPARHGVPEVTFVLQGADTTVFFGADTLRIPELDQVAQRFADIDLVLLPVNGLRIRPAFNPGTLRACRRPACPGHHGPGPPPRPTPRARSGTVSIELRGYEQTAAPFAGASHGPTWTDSLRRPEDKEPYAIRLIGWR